MGSNPIGTQIFSRSHARVTLFSQPKNLQEQLCTIILDGAWSNTERIFDRQWSNLIGRF